MFRFEQRQGTLEDLIDIGEGGVEIDVVVLEPALEVQMVCVGDENHQVLIIQKLKEVWINGVQQSGLKANVENIINISPNVAKANLKRLINDCLTIDEEQKRSKENTYQLLPAFRVYFEDVE